ncbi:cation-transporting P-type ATPase [Paraburkholderia sp. USG1]|uniref:P-type ATPase n=1 Tax=Paraburkholderia sp. USG1 TaxID=2952268 RepID=UPI00285FEF4A|nr:cation-transporting P-type ATPase [Paraburkholderia sp. USG1]MDR8397416.1 cation-transporting P-type ATPase [Paraburkholderia sp. USG1]
MTSAVVPAPIPEAASQPDAVPGTGLSSTEARRRLAESGANTLPDTAASTWRMMLGKFWAPVPWMLEAAVVLQCVLGRFVEAGIIAGLLVFNAILGVFQESRAQATLAALKSRLAMNASVLRDGAWSIVPAADLVKGDVVKLSLGGVVAADMRIVSGNALLDHSMLTGESVPIEATSGTQTFAGALVRRGAMLST